jgi:hypothetical protein
MNNINCARMDDNGDRMIGGGADARRTTMIFET